MKKNILCKVKKPQLTTKTTIEKRVLIVINMIATLVTQEDKKAWTFILSKKVIL